MICGVCGCACMHAHELPHRGRGCYQVSLWCSTLAFESSSLAESGAHWLGGLASELWGSHLSLSPSEHASLDGVSFCALAEITRKSLVLSPPCLPYQDQSICHTALSSFSHRNSRTSWPQFKTARFGGAGSLEAHTLPTPWAQELPTAFVLWIPQLLVEMCST